MPLAGQSELSIGPSALAYLGDLVNGDDGREQDGCKCIPLPTASVSSHALESWTCRASYYEGSTARTADRVARMAAALVKLEEEDAAKIRAKGGPVRRENTFARTTRRRKSDSASARSTRSTDEGSDFSALGSEGGLDSLLQFVPRFVQERCIERVDMESLSDHRRVCVLFVIAHVQVTPSSILVQCSMYQSCQDYSDCLYLGS